MNNKIGLKVNNPAAFIRSKEAAQTLGIQILNEDELPQQEGQAYAGFLELSGTMEDLKKYGEYITFLEFLVKHWKI